MKSSDKKSYSLSRGVTHCCAGNDPTCNSLIGPHNYLKYDTHMCTRESGILWAFRRRLTPKAWITLWFDPMESMYSRSTWAQQQGSGRLVARIVYNPISTSLRLVIDPLHGWSVLSALAFESGQWSRERKEKKKSDCWLCNPEYPENCMSPFSNICRPEISLRISHTHQILFSILVQYQNKPPSSLSHHLCEKWEISNSSGEKTKNFSGA